MPKNKRNYAFDLLRIIACYMVIVNHTNSNIFMNYFPDLSGKISLLFFVLSKIGVPIFFMISGALLLKKEDSLKHWFIHRILKFILIIIAITFFSKLINEGSYLQNFHLFAFIQQVIREPIYTPYWYLYTYLGILLVLPFLQKLVKVFQKKDYILYLSIAVVISSLYPYLTTFSELPSVSANVITSIFQGPLMYFIFGHFIINIYCKQYEFYSKKENSVGLLIFVMSVYCVYYLTAQEYYRDAQFSLNLDNVYLFPFLCMSLCLFYLCYRNFAQLNGKVISTIIHVMSTYTFGIYLFHPVLLNHPKFANIYFQLCSNMNDLVACFLYQAIVIACCAGITLLWKLIFKFGSDIGKKQLFKN